jgi:hypothetical protein
VASSSLPKSILLEKLLASVGAMPKRRQAVKTASGGRSKLIASPIPSYVNLAHWLKCDEDIPCGGCKSRNYPCSLFDISTQRCRSSKIPTKSHGDALPHFVNLLHLRLFHHFESVVSHIMVLDSWVWIGEVLPLALEVHSSCPCSVMQFTVLANTYRSTIS